MMIGTLSEEGIPVPARVEDVPHFAEQAAYKVMADPALKEALVQVCTLMLRSCMDNYGTPGPRVKSGSTTG